MHHRTLRACTPVVRSLNVSLALVIALLALAFGAAPPARAAGVIYVRSGATGANDGSNWTNAPPAFSRR